MVAPFNSELTAKDSKPTSNLSITKLQSVFIQVAITTLANLIQISFLPLLEPIATNQPLPGLYAQPLPGLFASSS